VGNWKFDDCAGPTFLDSTTILENATAQGGATCSNDVPNGGPLPPSPTPGGPTATFTPSPTSTFTPTATSSPTPTATATLTATPTATFTPTPTSTPGGPTPTFTPTASPGGAQSSLLLNGTTAYAEAPNDPELNPADRTFELAFKDDNTSYNHGRTRILTKGESTSNNIAYFASIDTNLLYIGLRSTGALSFLTVNLSAAGITPNAWHHLAASFNAASRQLTIYIDGVQRAQGTLTVAGGSNTQPLILGRSGSSGEYWRGKLDDVRVWNVIRTPAEINANWQVELDGSQLGLVGNWRFNEGFGSTAADSTVPQENASLLGTATWSTTDVPFATVLDAIDGARRDFRYPWHVVAQHNADYRAYVEAEMARMGPEHPLIRTQYLLDPLESVGRPYAVLFRNHFGFALGFSFGYVSVEFRSAHRTLRCPQELEPLPSSRSARRAPWLEQDARRAPVCGWESAWVSRWSSAPGFPPSKQQKQRTSISPSTETRSSSGWRASAST
jgi:hypothetical protein